MTYRSTRREFFQQTALAGAALAAGGYFTSQAAAEGKSPNEKLNVGMIGVNNQARFSLGNLRGENIVALCDIDDEYLADGRQGHPAAKTFDDFRKMLEHDRRSTRWSSARPTTPTRRPRRWP